MRSTALIITVALAVSAGPALAGAMPDAVARMLDAAGGDADKLKIVADLAKATNPDAVAEIDARVAALTRQAADAREAKLASQGLLDGWSGSADIGAFQTSGNTDNAGLTVGLVLNKDSRHWSHHLRAVVDYQEADGVKTKERYFAGYEGNYKINSRLYALLTLAYERDIFAGFERRFAESLGLGYRVIDNPGLKLSFEGGPSLRQTAFTDGRNENRFGARGGGNFLWQIAPALTFTEDATVFYDSQNTSFMSLTALNAKVTGHLTARIGYQLNTESNPPAGRRKRDSVTRLTLGYSF